MNIDISQWAVLWGAFLPLLVGLVTRYATDSGVKAVLLLVLNLVASILEQFFANPDNFAWGSMFLNAFAAFVIGVATHYGLWKPTNVSGGLQSVGSGQPRRLRKSPGSDERAA